MPHAAAPTGADIQALFVSAGVLPAGPLPLPFSLIDFDGIATAALTQWEQDTRWGPFVSTGIVGTRQYRVANTERIIDLNGGCLSDPSTVTVTVSPIYGGSPSSALQHQTQWELLPFDELASRGRPYTMLQIIRWRVGIYAVTGLWGRALTWPDDAWEAVRRAGVILVSGEVDLAAKGTPQKLKIGPTEVTYSENDLASLLTTCKSGYARAVNVYRRMTMM